MLQLLNVAVLHFCVTPAKQQRNVKGMFEHTLYK